MSEAESLPQGTPRRTPLYAEHVAAGARMVEFAGWEMPVQYASIVAEHHAVRRAAGLFDVSHMGEIELSGPGAEAACLRVFTNDVRALAAGRAQYSLIATEAGGIVDDVIVYRLAADRILVCVNASNAARDFRWVTEHANADSSGCAIRDRSAELALLAVQGPRAAEIVRAVVPEATSLARFGVRTIAIGGREAYLARTGYTGEDGFELFVAADAAVELWRALLAAGAPHGIAPVGLGARDTLRLEAALPLYGHELGEDVSPFEARVGWAVKLNRPEMVGYEALRAAKQGGVARKLVGLEVDGGIARQGCPVFARADVSGAEPELAAGTVTSGSHSPTLGRAVALAMVRATTVASIEAVEIRGKRRPARVTSLPFYVTQA